MDSATDRATVRPRELLRRAGVVSQRTIPPPSAAVCRMMYSSFCVSARALAASAALALPSFAAAQGVMQQGDAANAVSAQLDGISARGRALAAYEQASWKAYTQVLLAKPDPRHVQTYVAYKADSGWVVAFGRLSTKRDTFYVSNIAIPAVVGGKRVDTLFSVQSYPTPMPETDYLLRAARAIATAQDRFGATTRPYDAAALPAEDGAWYVYLVPGPNRAGVWPLGGDVRYRVSRDGGFILDTRKLHTGDVIEFDRSKRPEDAKYVAGVHNASAGNLPEDTDVYHVLTRQPRVFEYVFTPQHIFMVNEDGSIKVVIDRSSVVNATKGTR